MHKRTIVNPMPDSLDDITINPSDMLGPSQTIFGKGTPMEASQGDALPQNFLNQQQRSQVQSKVDKIVTEQVINKEILDERIRQDIEITKSSRSINLGSTPKDILKDLIAKGEHTEDKELFGHTWTFRALNQRDVLVAFSDIKDNMDSVPGRIAAITVSQIVYSLEALDGISVYEWFSDMIKRADYGTIEEYKIATRRALRNYIESMPPEFINAFDAAYIEVEKNRSKAFNDLKKG
jgi:hypothetical protein